MKYLVALILTLSLALTPAVLLATDEIYSIQGSTMNVDTVALTSTDTSQALPTASIVDPVSGKKAQAIFITCETNDVRWAVGGATPVADTLGHVLAAGQSMRMVNQNWITTFRLISSTAGAHGVLQISAEF